MATIWRRRAFLAGGTAALAGSPMANRAMAQEQRDRQAGQEIAPILFIHGDGDTAAHWLPVIWRFESNFYSRARLFTVDMRLPVARTNDSIRQPGRSSTEEATDQLTQEIARVRRVSGVERIVLVAHDRAGNTVRNFLRLNPRQNIKAAILCATPTRGRIASDHHLPGSEFNATSPYLRALNAMPGGTAPGVPTFTLSSNGRDKFAQPDGRFLGLPGIPTGIDDTATTLPGATNITLSTADHLQAAYAPEAFTEIWRIVNGEQPPNLRIRAEIRPAISGRITGWHSGVPTNIGLPTARLRIFPLESATARRAGPEIYDRTTSADGRWGPVEVDPEQHYEFEITARNHPTTHLYRPPFPRGSDAITLRPWLSGADDPRDGSLIVVHRPRGYFDLGRERIEIGDQAIQGEPDIPNENLLRAAGPAAAATVVVQHNSERIACLSWPAAERRVSIVELGE